MSVAAAILAAGQGSRFEGPTPKPLATLRGRPLVTWALDAAGSSGLRPLLLVVSSRASDIAGVAPDGVEVVEAHGAASGIAHSLRAALGALADRADVRAVCIGLADQPGVGAEAYRRLAAAHGDGHELAVATYGGERRNPVLLGRSLWREASALEGDVGVRALMGARAPFEVDCTDTGDPRDVDTLDDLHVLEEELPPG